MDDIIDIAHPDTLRATRLRALALAAVAAAAVFFLVVGLGAEHFALGDITSIAVIAGFVVFGLGGVLYPNLQGLFLSAVAWLLVPAIIGKQFGVRDDSLSLLLDLDVTPGDNPAIIGAVLIASVTFFIIARFHYIAVLDRSLWRAYDRYVIDHPDVFWWRRDASFPRPAMPRSKGTRSRDAVHPFGGRNGYSDPPIGGFEESPDSSRRAEDDLFWGPRYGSSTALFDDRPWGLYGDGSRDDVFLDDAFGGEALRDDDRGFTNSSRSTDNWP